MLVLAETVFRFYPFYPFLRPFLPFLLCPFWFLLGILGVMEATTSVWIPPSWMEKTEDRRGSNVPNPQVVAFGTQFGCCPAAGWVVSSTLLPCLRLLIFSVRFFIGYGGDGGGMGTTAVVRNGKQVI